MLISPPCLFYKLQEKEEKKRRFLAKRVRGGHYYIDSPLIKGKKILLGKTLYGRPVINFTVIDPRNLFAVIQIPGNKSFSVSHTALEKLDFEESIERKCMSQ